MASATETQALNAMRSLIAAEWHEEALLVDGATEVLVASGMARADAVKVSQAVFDKHLRIMGAN